VALKGSGRPSRLLAGWLNDAVAESFGVQVAATFATAQHCGPAVAHRAGVPAKEHPLEPSPDFAATTEALARVDPSFRDGTLSVVVVDLTRVVATQPYVAVDDPRVERLDPAASLERVGAVTLPVEPEQFPVSAFDESSKTWIVRSRGASVAVTGRYNGVVDDSDPGAQVFGFIVSAQPSRVTVVDVGDRLILVDGHHRAVSLLARGITRAPVALERSNFVPLGHGNLPRDIILGDRPPLLGDYLDDDVSCDFAALRTERVVVIAATELDIPD
jgi:hypothetical protein